MEHYTKKKKRKVDRRRPNFSYTSSTKSQNCESSDLEIPGFYYDKEKKKYFKILPGANNSLESAVITQECIVSKRKEENRLTDLKACVSKNGPKKVRVQSRQLSLLQYKKSESNISTVLQGSEMMKFGLISNVDIKFKIHQHLVKFLEPKLKKSLNVPCYLPISTHKHMKKLVPWVSNPSSLICMCSMMDSVQERLQVISVKSIDKSESNNMQLNLNYGMLMMPAQNSKFTSISNTVRNNREFVLYTTICAFGRNTSFAMIRNLSHSSSDAASQFFIADFNLSFKATWCSSWNPTAMQFSVGTEKSGLIIEVETRKLWELNSENSDVLCQSFKKRDPFIYSGTRKGIICGHDLRSNSTFMVKKLKNEISVCHLRVLEDENYLLASDFNGNIKKWDLRQEKVVQSYEGNVNTYSILPFHVSEEDNLLYSVGQDCYTRLWSLASGEILKSIPPPYPASITEIPSVYYHNNLGQKRSRPGLLMGIHDEFHFYSV